MKRERVKEESRKGPMKGKNLKSRKEERKEFEEQKGGKKRI